jgi:uncharacterized protein YjiS (DUF1127 family)
MEAESMSDLQLCSTLAADREAPAVPAPELASRLREARQWAVTLYQRARQRRALASLDERLLRDVGITPEQARSEANKPFWQR